MSPAVEEIDSGSPLPKIVGGRPTTTAKLAGVEVECVVDMGKSVCGGVQGGAKMLTLQRC